MASISEETPNTIDIQKTSNITNWNYNLHTADFRKIWPQIEGVR